MFELFVGRDAVRRHVEAPLEAGDNRRSAPKVEKRRRRPTVAVRSASAAALRGLAARLEPSPSR